jgi:hypothetical protein
MKRKWKLALIAVGLCILALRACALSGGPVSGQVIDETTGKPVADAIVVAHSHGSWTKIVGESSSACYHVETARTDAEGKYQIAAWTRPWMMRLTSTAQEKYGPVYDALMPRMPGIVAGYSDLAAVQIYLDMSEYVLNQTVNGTTDAFFVYFVREGEGEGIWRLESY